MSDELLIRHCSPTLAGVKTANLFSCPSASRSRTLGELRRLNLRWREKGLCALLLRHEGGRALVYVFRPRALERDLKNAQAQRLLRRMGYPCARPWHCLAHLAQRMKEAGEFPHEIGLFLSYPPEDVEGFMSKSAPCKCVGCWKVYGDAERACRLFEKYRRCACDYRRRWEKGIPLEKLIVDRDIKSAKRKGLRE